MGFSASKIDVSLFYRTVDGGFVLSQHMYMTDILKRACMEDCKSLSTPLSTFRAQVTSDEPYDNPTQYWSLAGALQYQTVTRPNLSYAVNHLCQHLQSHSVSHWVMLKRVLRYVKSTLYFGHILRPSWTSILHAYSDSDWAGDATDRKSTSGFAVYLRCNLISWVCRKQHTVARSSTEAEYKGLVDVAAEVTWVSHFCLNLAWLLPPRLCYGAIISGLHTCVPILCFMLGQSMWRWMIILCVTR